MIFQGQEFMECGSFNDWEGLHWPKADRFASILLAYKHLIALRKNLHGISAGLSGKNINLIHVNEEAGVISYHRWNEGGPKDDVLVVINFTMEHYLSYEIGFPRNGIWKLRFNSSWSGYSSDFKNVDVPDVVVDNGSGVIVLPPACALIFSQD